MKRLTSKNYDHLLDEVIISTLTFEDESQRKFDLSEMKVRGVNPYIPIRLTGDVRGFARQLIDELQKYQLNPNTGKLWIYNLIGWLREKNPVMQGYPKYLHFLDYLLDGNIDQDYPPLIGVSGAYTPTPPPASPIIPESSTEPRIFISYSSKDRQKVERISDELQKLGIDVWWDRIRVVGLKGGEDWESRLRKELGKSTHILVFLTENSVKSRWVRREIAFADQVINKPLIRGEYGQIDYEQMHLALVGTQIITLLGNQYTDFAKHVFEAL